MNENTNLEIYDPSLPTAYVDSNVENLVENIKKFGKDHNKLIQMVETETKGLLKKSLIKQVDKVWTALWNGSAYDITGQFELACNDINLVIDGFEKGAQDAIANHRNIERIRKGISAEVISMQKYIQETEPSLEILTEDVYKILQKNQGAPITPEVNQLEDRYHELNDKRFEMMTNINVGKINTLGSIGSTEDICNLKDICKVNIYLMATYGAIAKNHRKKLQISYLTYRSLKSHQDVTKFFGQMQEVGKSMNQLARSYLPGINAAVSTITNPGYRSLFMNGPIGTEKHIRNTLMNLQTHVMETLKDDYDRRVNKKVPEEKSTSSAPFYKIT